MTKSLRTCTAAAFLVLSSGSTAVAQSESKSPSAPSQRAALSQQAPPESARQGTAPSQEAQPRRLTLDEAIRKALTEHPVLRQAREAIRGAEARTKQARSGYYPQLSFSGIAKQGLSGASGALGLTGLVTSPLFRDIGASAAAFEKLYDFGRTAHQVKASQWASVSLSHALEAQQALVKLDVEQAYYTALQQQRLVKVDEQILADRQLIERQAKAFYDAQIKSKVDLSLADVGVSNANLELVQTRDRLRTAFAELNHAMGIDGEPAYTLEEPKIDVESPPTLASLLADSGRRPELLAFDAEIKAEEEVVARSRANKWPKLMALFSGGWVRFSDYSPAKLLLGAFGIDFPIFTGGRIEAEIDEANANLARARAARDSQAQDVRVQVQRAHNELLSAIESIRANEQLITQARAALRLARARYRVQIGSFVELTSAEAAASSAEAQYAQALYRYKIAQSTLNYVSGLR